MACLKIHGPRQYLPMPGLKRRISLGTSCRHGIPRFLFFQPPGNMVIVLGNPYNHSSLSRNSRQPAWPLKNHVPRQQLPMSWLKRRDTQQSSSRPLPSKPPDMVSIQIIWKKAVGGSSAHTLRKGGKATLNEHQYPSRLLRLV